MIAENDTVVSAIDALDFLMEKLSQTLGKWVIASGFWWKSVQIDETLGQEVDFLGPGVTKTAKNSQTRPNTRTNWNKFKKIQKITKP